MAEDRYDDDDQGDDYTFSGGFGDGKSTKDIVDEQSFPPVPNGRNDFFIKSVDLKKGEDGTPEPTRYEAWVASEEGGETDVKESFVAQDITVVWALNSNPVLTLKEYLTLPPDDEDEAQIFATSSSKPGKKKRVNWNRLRHMIGSLGFEMENGQIPLEARSFRNWKFWDDGERRLVSLDIQDQKDPDTGYKKPKLAPNGQPYKQVGMFSHAKSEDTLIRLGELEPEDEAPEDEEDEGQDATVANSDPEPEPEPEPEPAKPTAKPTTKPTAKPQSGPKPGTRTPESSAKPKRRF